MSKAAIVNALTFARVPLIFAWMVLAIWCELAGDGAANYFHLSFVALCAMVLSGFTDLLDGKLARRWQVVSTLGKLSDPLMDKVFYIVAFPTLAWIAALHGDNTFHEVALLAFAVLYILRDLWVTFIRTVGALYGAPVAAMMMGKVRTALSFPTAAIIYIYFVLDGVLGVNGRYLLYVCYAVEAFMTVLNLVSIVTYTRVYLPYMRQAMRK